VSAHAPVTNDGPGQSLWTNLHPVR
jgi:hypothetical protein